MISDPAPLDPATLHDAPASAIRAPVDGGPLAGASGSRTALVLAGIALAALAIAVGMPAPVACALLAAPLAAVDDWRTRTIPDRPLLAAGLLALLAAGPGHLATQWHMLLAAAAVGLLMSAAWFFGPEEMMGLGDAKMAALSAGCLAAVPSHQIDAVAWGVLVIPALLAVPLLAWCRRPGSSHRTAPFAPCLALAVPLTALLRSHGLL